MSIETIQLPGHGAVRGFETRTIPGQGNPLENFQLGIDGPVAELMVGQPMLTRPLGMDLFRTVRVPTVSFQYQTFGLEKFEIKNAERHMRAPFQKSELEVGTASGTLARYGWASLLDRDEIRNSEAFEGVYSMPLRIRERHQNLSRHIVEMALENKRATVALAAASYSASSPDLDVTVSNQWDDTSGDSRADVRALAAVLAGANGVSIEQIEVFLTHASMHAAQSDPTLLGVRQYTGLATVTADILREYWGVGKVTVGDSYAANAAGTAVSSLYNDVAILKVMQPLTGYDESEGKLDSFVSFKWQVFGRPSMPYYDEDRTSWAFPFEDWELATTVNTSAAAILRDTAA